MSSAEAVTQILIFLDSLVNHIALSGVFLWLAVRWFTGTWNSELLILWLSAGILGHATTDLLKRRLNLEGIAPTV